MHLSKLGALFCRHSRYQFWSYLACKAQLPSGSHPTVRRNRQPSDYKILPDTRLGGVHSQCLRQWSQGCRPWGRYALWCESSRDHVEAPPFKFLFPIEAIPIGGRLSLSRSGRHAANHLSAMGASLSPRSPRRLELFSVWLGAAFAISLASFGAKG